MTNSPNCSILISSCDAYSDVWDPFFSLFFKYWPDCPFPLYLVSETKKYDDKRVQTILIGEDKKWATNTRRALEHIQTPYVIYLQEDYLLTKKVDTDLILRLVEVLKNNAVGYIRLFPRPAPTALWSVDPSLGIYSKNSDYSICLQATLWKKDLFKKLLVDGESGWDMEIKGSKRVGNVSEVFLGVLQDKSAIEYYCTAIKKGVWFRDAVSLVRREGLTFASNRPIESLGNYCLRVTRLKQYTDKLRRLGQKK